MSGTQLDRDRAPVESYNMAALFMDRVQSRSKLEQNGPSGRKPGDRPHKGTEGRSPLTDSCGSRGTKLTKILSSPILVFVFFLVALWLSVQVGAFVSPRLHPVREDERETTAL